MITLILFAIFLIAFVAFVIDIYNGLIHMIEAIRNNEKQIDIQLDRRYKVFQSLIEVVKKYMDYEKSTLKEVVALRSQAQAAKQSGDQEARMMAENKISKLAGGLNVMFESYPDLKANQNAMQLQEEIVSTENKLAYAKQAFNDSIERYNATKKSALQSIIVSWFKSKLDMDFKYWSLSDDDIQKQENFRVEL